MCDGFIEPDLWEALITAGACWRAARALPRHRAEYEASAMMFSEEAAVLLSHDAAGWRIAATMGD